MTEKDTQSDRSGDESRMPPAALLYAADEILHMYDSVPFIICLLDSERRIISGNRQFREVTGWPESPVFLSDKACGILGCIHSLDDVRGCGFGAHCASCPLRRALLDTFETAARHSDIEYRTSLLLNGTRRDVVLLGSTARIETPGKQMVLLSLVDITERKLAEEALFERERLLNEIFEHGGVGVAHWDLDGRLLMLNQKACNNLGGGDPQQYLGSTMIEMFGNEAGMSYLERIKKTVESPEALEFEDRVELPIGIRWFHSVHTRVRDAEGRVTGVHIYANDITDLKQTEESLQQSKHMYDTLVSKITVGIYILRSTPEGSYTLDYVSPRMSELVNCSIESLLANPQNFFVNFHPDDRAGFVALNQEGISLLRPFDWKGRILVDGTVRWLHIESSPETQMDGDVLWHGVVADITESKQMEDALRVSENLLRDAQTVAGLGTYSLDIATGRWNSSDILDDIFGFDKKLDRSLSEWESILHPEDREMMTNYLSDEVLGKLMPFNREYRIIREVDGRTVWVHGMGRLEINEQDQPVRLIGTIQDITERKLVEGNLKKRDAEIEQFIYTVSHDLRSPLVTVKTFLGYLENDVNDGDRERISQDLQFIHGASDKMKELLDELLELSRIDRQENTPVRVSFRELLSEVCGALAGDIDQHRIDMTLPDNDLELFGDRARLCQIWQNLIENAIKYRGDDRIPSIELGFRHDTGGVTFYVKDNGIGIDPSYHTKIFGVFEKLNQKSAGVGLGLSMIQRIVEKYDGRIWVESVGQGQGSCFSFTLPRAISHDSTREQMPA
ncbi:MAG: PAS domain-containing sensor histidine kinase [Geobacteraceae bacterium]|nr:PAS domain-containing sensor histidine kinase [Geobacteraceae bacterium]